MPACWRSLSCSVRCSVNSSYSSSGSTIPRRPARDFTSASTRPPPRRWGHHRAWSVQPGGHGGGHARVWRLQLSRHGSVLSRRRISALRTVEDELIAAEVRAVFCSAPVGEGVEFLRSCLARKMKVGIVSNNSADAVHVFLDVHGLSADVTPVVGRALRHPELMKPNPWPIKMA